MFHDPNSFANLHRLYLCRFSYVWLLKDTKCFQRLQKGKRWQRLLLGDCSFASQIAKFMGPTWGPPGSCRPQVGPMLAPWTLLSGMSLPRLLLDVALVEAWNRLHVYRRHDKQIYLDTGGSISVNYKQRVLMHRHQGWNVRHGLCHIYMRYVYIYMSCLKLLFVLLFVHYCNVMVYVVYCVASGNQEKVQACLVTLWLFIISCHSLYKTTLGSLCSWKPAWSLS